MKNRSLRVLAAALVVSACGWWMLSVPTRPASAALSAASTTIIQKGIKENTSYTAGNSVFTSDITFTPRNGFVRLTVAHSVAAVPQLYLVGAASTALPLNSNVAMVADGLYVFDIPMRSYADSQAIAYNVRLSQSGTIRWMLVEEYSEGD